MKTPLLVRFARPVIGEEPVAPGSYDAGLGLRVLETPSGLVPVASCVPYARTVTKTDRARESDDRSVYLASITKTSDGREHTDVSHELDDGGPSEFSGRQDWIALVTKTLNRSERDDQ